MVFKQNAQGVCFVVQYRQKQSMQDYIVLFWQTLDH